MDDARLALAVTGEPILGPRQAALVDAATHRLSHGPPTNENDLIIFGWLTRVLFGTPIDGPKELPRG